MLWNWRIFTLHKSRKILSSPATRPIKLHKLRVINMKFGFDIDDTLINLREHAFQLYNKKLNQNVEVDLFHALDKVEIHELFGMTAEQGSEMWSGSLEEIYYTSCPPYPNAVDVLQRLEQEGHDIYYI